MDAKPILAIIGGGASGITAAVFAARKAQGRIKIIIFERMDRIGKKLLATGNGRCNFSNTLTNVDNYHGTDPDFTQYALLEFTPFSSMDFLSSLGIHPREENNGRLYPYSNQASSVLDGFRLELERLGVEIITGFKASELIPLKTGFKIVSEKNETYFSQKVIVASGGCASPNLGSDGSGFKILKALGHKVTKLTPALAQLKTAEKDVKSLQGIKINANVCAVYCNKILGEEEGEVLFTDYGLSGPPVLQLSGLIHKYGKFTLRIDLMPELNSKQVYDLLEERKTTISHLKCEHFFMGLFHKKLGYTIMKRSGIEKLSYPVSALSKDMLWNIANTIKCLVYNINATTGFPHAQVTAGGVLTSEFNDKTMESKLVKGLYCCGEIFDIYGDCGGFNLQWAFSSAYAAAKAVVFELTGLNDSI